MSPPSAMVMASGARTSAQCSEDPVGVHVAVLARRGALECLARIAPSGAGARSRRARRSKWRRRRAPRGQARGHRVSARSRGCANSSTSPRRFSRSSSAVIRDADRSAPSETPPASRSRSGNRVCDRSTTTRSASCIATGAHGADDRRMRRWDQAAALLRVEVDVRRSRRESARVQSRCPWRRGR